MSDPTTQGNDAPRTVAKRDAKPQAVSLRDYLLDTKRMDAVARVAPKSMNVQRLVASAVFATTQSPGLADAAQKNPLSFFYSVVMCAQLGLELSGPLGQAYLVPYSGAVKLMVGYRGMIDLTARGCGLRHVQPVLVFSDEEFTYELGSNARIVHKPKLDHEKDASLIAGYCIFTYPSGQRIVSEPMSIAELNKRRAKSQRANADAWKEWPYEQYKKTLVRHDTKVLSMSSEKPEARRLGLAIEMENRAENDESQTDGLIDPAAEIVAEERKVETRTEALKARMAAQSNPTDPDGPPESFFAGQEA